jgi:hypothetical protein
MLTNSGKVELMNTVTGLTPNSAFYIGLFTNNYTVVAGTVKSDLTSAPGFADQQMHNATGAVIVAGPRGQTTWFPTHHVNGSGSPQTIYGWYVYAANSGILWSAGNFLAPIVVANGATLTLNPYAQDDTL